uniref:Uncharacterized protein n=1 Tax=viral metagenome TaxID=1070528 RepID=A0A6H1ZN17_9ZZZZ
MATVYSRTSVVYVKLATLAADINTAIETLEVSDFVLQGTEFRDVLDAAGVSHKIVLLHAIERHLLPGGVIFPVSAEDRYSVGYVRFSGVTADAQTVTIQGRVYEFDIGGAVAPGSVAVDISGGASATQSVTALVAAINGDAGASVEALADTAGACCVLIGKAAVTAFTLATTCINGVVSGAAMVGGVAAGDRFFVEGSYTVTAADVTAWAAGDEVPILGMDDPGATPDIGYVQVMDATGGFGALPGLVARVAQIDANNWVLLLADPLVTLAATDVIRSRMIA